MCKRILPMILVLLVLMTFPMTVLADADFDLNKTGTLRICLRDLSDPEQPVGGTVCLLRVGETLEKDNNLTFRPTEDFAGSGISLEDLNDPGLARQLADYAGEQNIPGKNISADEKGTAVFSDLSAGLYLVTQAETVEGWMAMEPFLVSLPMYSAESGGWLYDITATPKLQQLPADPVSLTVVKKWKDNKTGRPEELTVVLLRDGEAEESVTLTAQGGWKHTWTDLEAAHEWTVEEVVPQGYTAQYSTSGSTVTITNTAADYIPPDDDLIQTGQLKWPVPLLVCAGLALMVVGLLLIRRGKQEA